MYIYVYVCIYIYVYVCIFICMFLIRTFENVDMYLIYICIHQCMYMFIYIYIHANILKILEYVQVVWDSEVQAFEGKRQRVLSNGMAVEIDADGKVFMCCCVLQCVAVSVSASCRTVWPLGSTQTARYLCLLHCVAVSWRSRHWNTVQYTPTPWCTVLQWRDLEAPAWQDLDVRCIALQYPEHRGHACLDQRHGNLHWHRWQGIVILDAECAYSTHFVCISIEPDSRLVVVCWAVKIGYPVCLCHCIADTARLKCIMVVLGTSTTICL